MNKNIITKNKEVLLWIDKFIVIFFIISSLYSFLIYWNLLESRDAAVYMYTGKLLRKGMVPYLDIWDHKTPGIYIYYSVLYFFSENIRHSALFCMIAAQIFTTISLFKLLLKFYSKKLAASSIILLLILYNWLLGKEGPYLIEEYIIFFQVITLWLLFNWERSLKYFLVGILCALSFLLKPTLISLWVAIFILWLFEFFKNKNYNAFLKILFLTFVGFVIPFLFVGYFFWSKGALLDLIDQSFFYNSIYVSNTFRFNDFFLGFSNVLFINFFVLPAWFYICWLYISKKISLSSNILLAISVLAFPFEIYISSLSGNSYPHYYYSSLLFDVIIIAAFINFIIKYVSIPKWMGYLSNLTSIFLFFLLITVITYNLLYRIPKLEQANNEKIDLINYLNDNNFSNKFCLVFGNELWVYLNTNVNPIDRYVYQYPLFKKGYRSDRIWEEFLTDFKFKRPAIFIDTNNPEMNDSLFELKKNYLVELREIIQRDYVLERKINNYSIYKLK